MGRQERNGGGEEEELFSDTKESIVEPLIMRGEEFEIKTSHIVYKQEIICRSMCGLPIYNLTISSIKPSLKKKRVIYITARVHAGETHSSFIMAKLIDELCSSNAQEKYKFEALFQNFVIKLVPMINPDGVCIGNARTSLIGLDLNRRWNAPNLIIHPEVFFLKKEMKRQAKLYDGI